MIKFCIERAPGAPRPAHSLAPRSPPAATLEHALARRLSRAWAWLLLPLLMLAVFVAAAAEPAGSATPPANSEKPTREQIGTALARAQAAVVGIEATAVEDAASLATLGSERQGSGVVIGADGLVLTIGYLILEAERVDLVFGDDHRVPARVVAYDLATGFGLVQALAPLGKEPAPLGDRGALPENEPLLVASGGEVEELTLAKVVSRRPFSGYWEYHIDSALFTAPARPNHSG